MARSEVGRKGNQQESEQQEEEEGGEGDGQERRKGALLHAIDLVVEGGNDRRGQS